MAKKTTKRETAPSDEPRERARETTVQRVADDDSSDNTSPLRKIAIVALLLLGLFLLFNVLDNNTDKQSADANNSEDSSQTSDSDKADNNAGNDDGNSEEQTAGGQSSSASMNETDTAFNFTVREGDSFTALARQVIASLDSSLTPAERVAAETKLAQDANAELLNTGQTLAISKDQARAAVDWAKKLNEEEKACWQTYADLVAW